MYLNFLSSRTMEVLHGAQDLYMDDSLRQISAYRYEV